MPDPGSDAAEPEPLPLPEFDDSEPDASPLPEFDAAEPSALPLPEWPSLERLREMISPIEPVPVASDETRTRRAAQHKAAMERHSGTAKDPALNELSDQGGAEEWKTFKVSGDGLESDTRSMRDSLDEIAKNTNPRDQNGSAVSFQNIERQLTEVVSLLRRMA